MTAVATAETVSRQVEAQSSASQEVRFIKRIDVGQSIRQGDIYLTRVKSIPQECSATSKKMLVQGSTKGSRHEVVGATVYDLANPTPLKSVMVKSEGRFDLIHPEHAHFSLPGGCYSVTQQRDFASEELRAVRD